MHPRTGDHEGLQLSAILALVPGAEPEVAVGDPQLNQREKERRNKKGEASEHAHGNSTPLCSPAGAYSPQSNISNPTVAPHSKVHALTYQLLAFMI